MIGLHKAQSVCILLGILLIATGCTYSMQTTVMTPFAERANTTTISHNVTVSPSNPITALNVSMSQEILNDEEVKKSNFSSDTLRQTIEGALYQQSLIDLSPKKTILSLDVKLTNISIRSTISARFLGETPIGYLAGGDFVEAEITVKDASGQVQNFSKIKTPVSYSCPERVGVMGIPVAGCDSRERMVSLYNYLAGDIRDLVLGKTVNPK